MRLTPGIVWHLVRPYWVSDDRWRAYGLLATIIGLNVFLTYIGVRQTYWQKNFFDALVERDLAAFWAQLRELVFIVVGIVGAGTARVWFEQALEMRWRAWLTNDYLRRWLGEAAFARIELEGGTDNPDQRIAEDLRLMAGETLRLSVGLLNYLVDFFTFAAVIWGLSGALSFSLAGLQIHIPGYMLWAAILYALIGSVLIEKIGHRLVPVDYQQQRREADFRFLLVRVRENAAQIAVMGGSAAEQAGLDRAFAMIRANWAEVMRYTKRVTALNALYVQSSMVIPYLVTGPRYFAGEITIGVVMQLNSLFNRVRGSLSWFVYRYQDLAMLRAVFRRLAEFDRALLPPDAPGIRIARSHDDALRIEALCLRRPDGRTLADLSAWAVRPGERWLIQGPSGSGKSTLLAAMAGLWRAGSGTIMRPEASCMFVPQRLYLPGGSLSACLAYPRAPQAIGASAMAGALETVGLGTLVAELEHEASWMRRLSPGEQQRIAFARALLHRPAFLFLDESTSALDLDAEARMYRLIVDTMPETAIVSVAHRPSLHAFHTHVLHWATPEDAAGLVPARRAEAPVV